METIFGAALLLGALIFIHELGHFLTAKATGVGVEKFSLGFGKQIFGRRVGETEYLISAVPLGGYVKLTGEDPSEEVYMPEKSFSGKPVLVRLGIVSAGPIFNLLFAVTILSSVYMLGIDVPSDKAWVGKMKEGYPAMEAGLSQGDKILEIDGKAVETWMEMADIIHNLPGKEIRVKIERGGDLFTLKITTHSEIIKDIAGKEREIGLIGIEPMLVTERFAFLTAVKAGIIKTWDIIYMTFWVIKKMFVGQISPDNLGGPILIFQKAGEFVRKGYSAYMSYAALISINLGILNLLPIPILDGGHIMFFLVEAIIGRPVSINIREKAQHVGLFLLVTLMVFAFYNDIMRFIK